MPVPERSHDSEPWQVGSGGPPAGARLRGWLIGGVVWGCALLFLLASGATVINLISGHEYRTVRNLCDKVDKYALDAVGLSPDPGSKPESRTSKRDAAEEVSCSVPLTLRTRSGLGMLAVHATTYAISNRAGSALERRRRLAPTNRPAHPQGTLEQTIDDVSGAGQRAFIVVTTDEAATKQHIDVDLYIRDDNLLLEVGFFAFRPGPTWDAEKVRALVIDAGRRLLARLAR